MTGTGTGKFKWLLPLLLLALILSSPASASHYRFGHITWEPRPDISPTTVDFRFVLSARRSFFGSPEIGDVVTRASDRFRFGDGSSTQSLEFRVIASNPEEDWIMAEAREPGSGLESVIRKTYDTPVDADGQPWKAHYSSLARLGNIHNRGSRFRLETSVDLSKGFRSPVSNQAPVLSCERGAVCGFSVPAVDPDGNGLRWRSAVGSESNVPRLPAEDFHIDPDTGLISWPTTDDDPLGFYSVPLQIEDLDEDGNVRSSVPIEFLINLQDFAENNPPVFDVPPTPPSDETLTIPPERELSFVVQATDPDAQDSVVLNHTGLPGGAEFETEPGNPAQGTFRWTPEESQLGEHLLTFTAIDDRNNASLPHPVRLEVVEPGIRDVSVVAEVNTENMRLRPESLASEPEVIREEGEITLVEWFFPSMNPGDVEALDFSLDLENPEPGEQRLVTRRVVLEYRDINGNRIRRELDPRFVEVLPSIFEIEVATDRQRYGPDDEILVDATLANLSRFSATADVSLDILDEAGAIVAEVTTATVRELASGASHGLETAPFSASGVLTGDYRARASVFEEGERVAEASAPFLIELPDGVVALEGRIAPDRSVYDPGDIVRLEERLTNVTDSQLAEDLAIETRILSPDGDIFWMVTSSLAQLVPGAARDREHSVTLGPAPAGDYEVELDVFNPDGVRIASDRSGLAVRSSAETGVGITGELDLSPQPLLRTETLGIAAELANSGNADLVDASATLSVIDPRNQEVLAEWSRPVDELEVGERIEFARQWESVVPGSGNHYRAVLSMDRNGEQRILDTTRVVIDEKLLSQVETVSQGHLLALVDGPASLLDRGLCKKLPRELEFAVRTPLALHEDAAVRLELYDGAGGLVATESATPTGWSSRWVERGRDGEHLALSLLDTGRIQAALMNLGDRSLQAPLRLVAIVDSPAGEQHFESGYFRSDCDLVRARQSGDFDLVAAWGKDHPDPHGPSKRPWLAEQRRYLEAFLREHGWAYTLTSDRKAFIRGFHSGDYNAFALFNERIKLPELLQKKLVEAVRQGAGLLVSGAHDWRNGRLDRALGIRYRGHLPLVAGVQGEGGDPYFPEGEADFQRKQKPMRVRLNGAETVAIYSKDGGMLSGLFGRARQHLFGDLPAVTRHRHGEGHAVHIGYDLLLEAAAHDEAFHDEYLNAALTRITPEEHSVGDPKGLAIRIHNRGTDTEGELLLPATEGVEILDPGPGRITEEGDVHWRFRLPHDETLSLPLWLRRDSDAPASLEGLLRSTTESGRLVDYGVIEMD